MSWEWYRIGDLCLAILLICVYTPLGIYWILCLNRYRNRSFYYRREHPILTNVSMLISISASISGALFPFLAKDEESFLGKMFFLHSAISIYGGLTMIAYSIGSQAYYLYFKSNLDKVLSETKWKSIVDRSLLDDSKIDNWFIKHNGTYGNRKWIKYHFGIYCLLWFIIDMICGSIMLFSNYHEILSGMAFMVVTITIIPAPIAYIYIIRHSAYFEDVYHIYHQSSIQWKLLLIKYISFFIMTGVFVYASTVSSTDTVLWMWIWPTSIDLYIIYLNTIWIIKQNDFSIKQAKTISMLRAEIDQIDKIDKRGERDIDMSLPGSRAGSLANSPRREASMSDESSTREHGSSNNNNNNNNNNNKLSMDGGNINNNDDNNKFNTNTKIKKNKKRHKKMAIAMRLASYVEMQLRHSVIGNNENENDTIIQSLKDVLINPKTLSLFMSHLAKEFATENMAFLMESQQFAAKVIESTPEKGDDWKDIECEKRFIAFAQSETPKSSIVSDSSLTLHEIAMKLFQKYVESGSEYEINVSYMTRQEVITKIESINFNIMPNSQLFLLFESCEFSMIALLQPSFLRLKNTKEYQQSIEK